MLNKEDIKKIIDEVYQEKLLQHTRKIISDSIDVSKDDVNNLIEEVFKEINWQEVNTIKWIPLYTASYIQTRFNKNYYSIINERCCIKVGDKYILHEDIINSFKTSLQNV